MRVRICSNAFVTSLIYLAFLSPQTRRFSCTCLEFLGITIDTVDMVFRLPVDKVLRLHFLLTRMFVSKKVLLEEMQSLLGLLVFASKVIPMERIFVWSRISCFLNCFL